MKLNKTTLGIPLAALMLVIAAGAVLATTGDTSAPAPAAPAAATPTPTPTPAAGTKDKAEVKDPLLTDVLTGLVTKGTITEAQKTAILGALDTERATRKAARDAAHKQAQADRKQIKDFLADGVITQDEFNKLPADSPLRKMTTLMADGKITLEELKALGGMFGGGKWGHGGGMWGGDKGAKPTPTPTSGTGG
jgi:hypothetical protein